MTAGMWIPVAVALESLLCRLESMSLEPGFLQQRETALAWALNPYVSPETSRVLAPLPEEAALARLYLYADFLPQDGQASLIEQVRDLVAVHVPDEERQWLDPLRHSYMDLLEITELTRSGDGCEIRLRSLGDGQAWDVSVAQLTRPLAPGQVLLTRLVRAQDRVVLPGTALVMSASIARSVFEAADEARREREALAGSFELGEWAEFAKRYGHLLLWSVAQTRFDLLLGAESQTRYETEKGTPVLPAMALYEHHEARHVADEMDTFKGWRRVRTTQEDESVLTWIQGAEDGAPGGTGPVARVTLSPTQLWVECDTRERLDALKHHLASTFGFSLHFRGESVSPPRHRLVEPDLTAEGEQIRTVTVSQDEEQRLLASFLEHIYLEWADHPSPALGGQTPRHAAAVPQMRQRVASLIHEIEQNDLARRRTGTPGYDYDKLREHVGLS